MPNSPHFFVLIPCGGSGSRSGSSLPKQYQPIAGLPMVAHTLAAFAQVARVDETLCVIAPDDTLFAQHVGSTHWVAPCASDTRAKTVLNGLKAMLTQGAQESDWVLVHDAARCLITPAQINALIDACQHDPVGGLLALPLPDTLKTALNGHESSAMEALGHSPKLVHSSAQNFKVTYPEDFALAEAILQSRHVAK
jgi:2-C-methyl-D-erythritol 4-phosphate cytidylyltransferase